MDRLLQWNCSCPRYEDSPAYGTVAIACNPAADGGGRQVLGPPSQAWDVLAFSRVTQKAQLSAQALHLIEQIEHGFEPDQIEAVGGPKMFDSTHGINRFFRKFHHPIRWLSDRSYKAGATIDQNGTAGDTPEVCSGIQAVENVVASAETTPEPEAMECPDQIVCS